MSTLGRRCRAAAFSAQEKSWTSAVASCRRPTRQLTCWCDSRARRTCCRGQNKLRLRRLEVPEKPLDIVELKLRPEALAETFAQLLQNAPRPLRVDLAGDLHCKIVAIVATAHWPAERIGVLLGACLPASRSAIRPGAGTLLLHRLRQTLGAFPHGIQRAPLAVDGAVSVPLPELTFRLTHGLAGIAQLTHLVALALLSWLAHSALAKLLKELIEAVP